jgi:hypothetical protein
MYTPHKIKALFIWIKFLYYIAISLKYKMSYNPKIESFLNQANLHEKNQQAKRSEKNHKHPGEKDTHAQSQPRQKLATN